MTADVGKIYLLIPKIMADIAPIGKNRTAMGYKYRGIDDVYNELQPHLAKHGVFVVPEVLEDRSEERQSTKGSVLIYRVLKIRFNFFADDGSGFQAIAIGEGMDTGDKASNKAMSAAFKCVVFQVFCIPTEEPKDAEVDTHEVRQQTPVWDPPKNLSAEAWNDDHRRALSSLLRIKGVPATKWSEIGYACKSQPADKWPAIVEEMK